MFVFKINYISWLSKQKQYKNKQQTKILFRGSFSNINILVTKICSTTLLTLSRSASGLLILLRLLSSIERGASSPIVSRHVLTAGPGLSPQHVPSPPPSAPLSQHTRDNYCQSLGRLRAAVAATLEPAFMSVRSVERYLGQ